VSKQRIPISWNPCTDEPICRRIVDPLARDPLKLVTLAWLRKHAPEREYMVQWWEGPSDREGEWKFKRWPEKSTKLRDVKAFASMVAGAVTVFEVDVKITAHVSAGWMGVWEFGHYQRETAAAKKARGES
jgi:hypothetical protein